MEKKNPSEHYAQMLSTLVAIGPQEIASLNMPAAEAIQEGYRVTQLVEQHYERLLATGVGAELLDSMYGRAAAYAHSVATVDGYVTQSGVDTEVWKEIKARGYGIRRRLLIQLRYACRQDTQLLEILDGIAAGRGDMDMVRDLLGLYEFARAHRVLVEGVGGDMVIIEQVLTTHNELRHLDARISTTRKQMDEAARIASQAWTYLWKGLTEVYAAGRYAFMDEPDIEAMFYVEYLKQKNSGAQRQQSSKSALEPVAAI